MSKIEQLRRDSPRLAYMTGEYPRVSYTFIQREVRTLREFRHHVQTFSVRRPAETEVVGAEGAASRASTIYLLPPRALFRTHLAQLLFSKAISFGVKAPPGSTYRIKCLNLAAMPLVAFNYLWPGV